MIVLLQIASILTIVIGTVFLLLTLYVKGARKVRYQVFLLIVNPQGEYLLIYDKAQGRMTLPFANLPDHEIPTRIIRQIVKETVGCQMEQLRLSPLFHKEPAKYDRVRDDYPPACVAQSVYGKKKFYQTLYVLEDSTVTTQLSRMMFPYPEYFTYEEIMTMEEAAIPDSLCRYFIETIHARRLAQRRTR